VVLTDREAADVAAVGVVDPERPLVGREAEAVGLLEVVDEQREPLPVDRARTVAAVELLVFEQAPRLPLTVGV